MKKRTFQELIDDGLFPKPHVTTDEDEYNIEIIFPNTRVCFGLGADDLFWCVVSKDITASGPIK